MNMTKNISFLGKKTTFISNGTFHFSDIVIYGDFSSKGMLKIYPNIFSEILISDFFCKNEHIERGNHYFYFPVIITECMLGQTLIKYKNTSFSICSSCSPGTFSFNKYGICQVCLEGADCSQGILDIKPGYWMVSQQIFKCFPFENSCL